MKTLVKIITLLIIVFFINEQKLYADEKIKIGLLIPLSGKQNEIGKSILKSTRLALNKIDNSGIFSSAVLNKSQLVKISIKIKNSIFFINLN